MQQAPRLTPLLKLRDLEPGYDGKVSSVIEVFFSP